MMLTPLLVCSSNIVKNYNESLSMKNRKNTNYISDNLDIEKLKKMNNLFELSKELNRNILSKDFIIHEIDIYPIKTINNTISIVSKMKSVNGDIGIKGLIQLEEIVLKDNYIEEFEKEVFELISLHEQQLIKLNNEELLKENHINVQRNV